MAGNILDLADSIVNVGLSILHEVVDVPGRSLGALLDLIGDVVHLIDGVHHVLVSAEVFILADLSGDILDGGDSVVDMGLSLLDEIVDVPSGILSMLLHLVGDILHLRNGLLDRIVGILSLVLDVPHEV